MTNYMASLACQTLVPFWYNNPRALLVCLTLYMFAIAVYTEITSFPETHIKQMCVDDISHRSNKVTVGVMH